MTSHGAYSQALKEMRSCRQLLVLMQRQLRDVKVSGSAGAVVMDDRLVEVVADLSCQVRSIRKELHKLRWAWVRSCASLVRSRPP